jgi:hypothetical protein
VAPPSSPATLVGNHPKTKTFYIKPYYFFMLVSNPKPKSPETLPKRQDRSLKVFEEKSLFSPLFRFYFYLPLLLSASQFLFILVPVSIVVGSDFLCWCVDDSGGFDDFCVGCCWFDVIDYYCCGSGFRLFLLRNGGADIWFCNVGKELEFGELFVRLMNHFFSPLFPLILLLYL